MKIRVLETGYVFDGYLNDEGEYTEKYNIFHLKPTEAEIVDDHEQYAAIWVTRNKAGDLELFANFKPEYDEEIDMWNNSSDKSEGYGTPLLSYMTHLPEITFENSPKLIKIVI